MRSGQELPSGLQNRPGPGTTKELAESVRRPGIALTGSLDSIDSAVVQKDTQTVRCVSGRGWYFTLLISESKGLLVFDAGDRID